MASSSNNAQNTTSSGGMQRNFIMATPTETFGSYLKRSVQDYVNSYAGQVPPEPEVAEEELLDLLICGVNFRNTGLPKERLWIPPKELPLAVIADLMVGFNHVVNLQMGATGSKLPAVYIETGERRGIYSTDVADIRCLAKRYKYTTNPRDVEQQLVKIIEDVAPLVPVTLDANLVAVNNGIYDVISHEFFDFDPDRFVFTHKCAIDWNPNASLVSIDGWNVDKWISGLSDDKRIVDLLWQFIAAAVRPNVPWDMCAFFCNPDGSAGKGTFCKMLANIVGADATAFLSVEKMTRQFSFDGLERKQLIIGHENSVNKFLDNIEDFKALVTSDPIMVDRKHQQGYSMEFHGLIIQCFNSTPKIADHSGSFFRRVVFVPFTKSFKAATENKAIKDDYLTRPEVLEYVLKKALEMDFDHFDVPPACDRLKYATELANNTVFEFADDVLEQATWKAFPRDAIYAIYRNWHEQNNPSSRPMKQSNFREEMMHWCKAHKDAGWEMRDNQFPSRGLCDGPEYLFVDYHVADWMGPKSSRSRDTLATPIRDVPDRIRGLCRTKEWLDAHTKSTSVSGDDSDAQGEV